MAGMTDATRPSLAAAVVLFDERRRVLLTRQGYGLRLWSLPGGVLEASESPSEAAVREVIEETGLHVRLVHLIGVYYLRRSAPGLGFAFLGRFVGDAEPYPQSDEIAELDWFDTDALPSSTVESLATVVDDAAHERVRCFRTLDIEASWVPTFTQPAP
jgi:8-oxo-dGTP pyrophosphatase MutT (NUDIX family)